MGHMKILITLCMLACGIASLAVADKTALQLVADDSAEPAAMATSKLVKRSANPPVFLAPAYTVTVSKTIPVGTSVLSVTAVDSDGDTVEYSIQGSSPQEGAGFFTVDPVSGVISVNKSLLDTPVAQISLTIGASDGGSPAQSATVLAMVNLVGDLYAPEWAPLSYMVAVLETSKVGAEILRLSATDADTEAVFSQVQYALAPNSSDYFSIDKDSGVISIKRPLYEDAEKPPYYLIRVSARSLHLTASSSATVIVNVTRNEHAPFIENLPATIQLNSTTALNSTIFEVRAMDYDAPPYSDVAFSLAPNDSASRWFSIEALTGVISTSATQSLDDDRSSVYRLLVLASDAGVPSLVGSGTLTVSVYREPLPGEGGGGNVGMIVGAVVGGIAVAVVIAVAVLFVYKWRKNTNYDKPTRPPDVHAYSGLQPNIRTGTGPHPPLPPRPVSPSSPGSHQTSSGHGPPSEAADLRPAREGEEADTEDHVYLELRDDYDSLQPQPQSAAVYCQLTPPAVSKEEEGSTVNVASGDDYEVPMKR